MELKPGYKQTEVGVIPEEWEVLRIKDCTAIKTGKRNTQDRVEDGQYPFFVRSQTIERINSYSFDGEAVLTAGDGVGTGKVFHYVNGRFDFHQRVYKISDFSPQLSGQFFHLVFSTRFYERIMSMTAKSSVDSVRLEMIADMQIPLPPLPEQEAIAEALSDADALLGALDRHIAKNRDLKQAAMQQLLTGQTRLPGFGGEWKVKRLGEGISLFSGHHVLAQHCNIRAEGVPYLTGPADFQDGWIRHTKFTDRPTTMCSPNDILVTVKGSGSGTLVLADGAYCISRQLMAIRVGNWDNRFIYYSLLENAAQFKAASTGLIPGLSRCDILEQPLPLPPTVAEQTAIAEVLSDMDAELAALEQRREKTRALKQAMMQELLTGRTRLV